MGLYGGVPYSPKKSVQMSIYTLDRNRLHDLPFKERTQVTIEECKGSIFG
jgi:hypothetical protein